jgi:uroporphyrinogen decarboxylase
VLYAPHAHIEREVKRILDENAGRPGHIFNLGHGILPNVPPENAKFMVECVHRLSGR